MRAARFFVCQILYPARTSAASSALSGSDRERKMNEEICDGNNTYTLRGSIYDGELTLNGYDSIPGISHAYGDGEAAYVYNFDRENTQKLTEIFHTENLLESLKKFFGGKKALTEFENLCRENGIYFQAEDINLRLSDRHFVL